MINTTIPKYPPNFRTTAWERIINSRGTKILGEIEAESLILAKAHLRKNGVNAKKIKRKSTSTFSLSTKEKICSQDITIFARQMATMLNAGVPLVQSLNIVSKGTDKQSVQELVNSIKNDIEAGQSFSDIFKEIS